MLRFNNDYNKGALDCVLEALNETNASSFAGYGEDEQCEKAIRIIRELVGNENAEVKFFPGATQANFVVISAALNNIQSVISADTGHINCHEAASIENTGHKVLSLKNTDGKITAEQIRSLSKAYYESGEAEYLTEPKMVYLSFPTEQGTLYSLSELTEISAVCREYGMYLFVDGARMGYGLGSEKNDVALKDFSKLCDVFYLGGTKCGALFGEAVVITNDCLKRRFKAYMKQNGAVLAKGWLLGLQFSAMLESGEYFSKTKRADELAMKIKKAFKEKNIPEWVESFTNQQFFLLTAEQMKKLAMNFSFETSEKIGERTVCRFCTSWATTDNEAEKLIDEIKKL